MVTQKMYHYEFPKLSPGKEKFPCPDRSNGEWETYCDNGEVKTSGQCDLVSTFGYMPYQNGAVYGPIKSERDGYCLDYNYNNGNVYMHPCHGGGNQKWHINPDGSMGTQHDAKCLDYNYNSMNVYMHDCHGGSNQKWVHPQRTLNAEMPQPAGAPAGELKTEYDDNCLDYNYNDGNVYMHPCHGGANQQWFFDATTGQLKTQWDDKCLDYDMGNTNT